MWFDGPLYLTRALIEPMVRDRYGRILFFVGDGAISARGSGRTHLSAAKMGLIGMARGLASEFAPHNIRVDVVSPGSIDTRRDNPEWYQGHLPNAAGRPVDGFGRLAAARPARDRLPHLFKGTEAELILRRLAGPALRELVTGRRPAEMDPEIGEARAWAEYRWRHPRSALCGARRPRLRRAAPARVTGSQPGKMGRLSQASRVDDARARTPGGV